MTDARRRTRRQRLLFALSVVAIALTLQLVGAQPAVSQSGELMAYSVSRDPGLDPGASTWRTAPTVEVALSAQQSTWPFGGGSIRGLEAQAVHTDDMLYIRMSWADDTSNSDALAVDQFVDAAAIEFPAQAASSVPALCMGQSDSGVNIWHWQAGADGGRPESIEELSSNGYVDRYPSTDDLYFPAREAGNPVATRPPIQNLVALGFGTLEPADDQLVQGGAEWASGRWSVVFARELSHESAEQVDLGGEVTTDVVFAVWDGEADERNGMKSVSPFVVLYVSPDGTPRNVGAQLAILIGGAVGLGGFVLREVTTHRARQASSVPSSS